METNNLIRVCYILLSILWLVIIVYTRIKVVNMITAIICVLPPIIMVISFNYIGEVDEQTESNIVSDNYVSIYILVSIPILAYLNSVKQDKKDIIEINVIAILLIMLSTVDIWVPQSGLTVVRHIKTSLQTMAMTLFVYSFYIMYIEEGHIGTNPTHVRPLIPMLPEPVPDI